jgi:hypothetical protein
MDRERSTPVPLMRLPDYPLLNRFTASCAERRRRKKFSYITRQGARVSLSALKLRNDGAEPAALTACRFHMPPEHDRRNLARQLRDDAAIVRRKMHDEGERIAETMKQAADLLDGRAEDGIKPLRYPDS